MPTLTQTPPVQAPDFPVAAVPGRGSFEPITVREAAARRAAVENARGLLAIEGLAVSPEAQADNEAWVRGEITMDQKLARLHARALLLASQEA